MFIVSKTIIGSEFIYSNKYSILCKNEKEARKIADFLNSHNDTAIGDFKLKDSEVWHVYNIDKYDTPPRYKLISTKNTIKIREYDD